MNWKIINNSRSFRCLARLALSLALSLGFFASSNGQSSPQQTLPPRVASWEGVSEYVLSNGLQVLLVPDPSIATITVNVTYLVGSRQETPGQRGWAHLVEHMSGRSTLRHPRIDWELGARGVDWNALTLPDSTVYISTFTASEANLAWSLELNADCMTNATFKEEDLASEKGIVRAELDLPENEAARQFYGPVMKAAYPTHSYAYPAEGLLSDIEQTSIDGLRSFYKTFYRPDNAVLIVTGNFTEDTAMRLINQHFGMSERPAQPLNSVLTTSQVAATTNPVHPESWPYLVASYYAPPRVHQDPAALDVATRALTQYADSPLYVALVMTRKASEVFNRQAEFKEPGLIVFGATIDDDKNAKAALRMLINTLEKPGSRLGDAQIERAKFALLAESETTRYSSQALGTALGQWAAMGDWRHFFLYRENLSKVTARDVSRVIKRYFQAANRAPARRVRDEEAKPGIITNPDTQMLEQKLEKFNAAPVSLPHRAPFNPAPDELARNITYRKTKGLELAFLSKPTYRQTVNVHLQFSFSNDKPLTPQQKAISKILFTMIKEGDTARFPGANWQDRMNRIPADIRFTNRNNELQIAVRTQQDNLFKALRLAAEKINLPAFTLEDFEQAKRTCVADIQGQLANPSDLAKNELLQYLDYGPAGLSLPTPALQQTEKTMQAVTLDDVKQFYREFYRTATVFGAVVGEVAPETVAPRLTELFGNATRRTKLTALGKSGTYSDRAPLRRALDSDSADTNAFLTIGQNLDLTDTDADYPALIAGNYLLGDKEFLQSRLLSRLRETLGLTYKVGTAITASPEGGNGRFVFKVTCDAKNIQLIEQLFQEELNRVLREGFTSEEVAVAKSGYLQTQRLKLSEDTSLAQDLAWHASIGRSYSWDAALEKRINELTPEMVLAALRKHLRPEKFTVITAGNVP